jgi:hypothetical protein
LILNFDSDTRSCLGNASNRFSIIPIPRYYYINTDRIAEPVQQSFPCFTAVAECQKLKTVTQQ